VFLKTGLGVVQGHWKWHRSIDHNTTFYWSAVVNIALSGTRFWVIWRWMISLVSYHEEPIFSCFLLRYVLSFVVPLVCFCYSLHSGGRHLEFRKKCLTLDWIKISAPNFMRRCVTAMRRWHVTKSRNRKLIHVTTLNECRQHGCDALMAYKSSQLTGLYFKPMQNSPVRGIV